MLKNQTIDKLRDMKLKAMAQMLGETDPELLSLPFEERFGMMVEKEWMAKKNSKIKRLVRNATLGQNACIEDIDYQTDRAINKQSILELASCVFIEKSLTLLPRVRQAAEKPIWYVLSAAMPVEKAIALNITEYLNCFWK